MRTRDLVSAIWLLSSPVDANAIVNFAFSRQLELKFVWSQGRCVQRDDGAKQSTHYVKN